MHKKTSGPELRSDRIRDALSDEIAGGVMHPGEALDEKELARRFGVSRTPVREALRQLATSGQVEARPHRGMVVARVTPERIRDLFETTAEVEAMCVRLATYRMTPAERGHLTDLWENSLDVVGAGDFDAYDRVNRDFHETIYTATRNAFMAEQAMDIRIRLLGFRRTQLRFKDRLRSSRAEHGEILTLMARGDGDGAARAMRAHIFAAASALERYIASISDTSGRGGSEGSP